MHYKHLFPILALSVIVASCGKTYDPGLPSYDETKLSDLFKGLETPPQKIIVAAGQDTIVYGAKGTMLHFYPNSFKDENDHIITSGAIEVSLVENYRGGDMIRNRMPTETEGGALLQTGGSINIDAASDGKPVFANTYDVGFKQNEASATEMTLYTGSKGPNGAVKWNATSTTIDSTERDPSASGPKFLRIFPNCTTFHYMNCDRLCKTGQAGTTINVIAPDSTFTPENTQIFLFLPDIPAVTQNRNHKYTPTTRAFAFGDDGSEIPIDMNYRLVTIAVKGGQYYYSENIGKTIAGGMNIDITPALTPGDSVIAKLNGL